MMEDGIVLMLRIIATRINMFGRWKEQGKDSFHYDTSVMTDFQIALFITRVSSFLAWQ